MQTTKTLNSKETATQGRTGVLMKFRTETRRILRRELKNVVFKLSYGWQQKKKRTSTEQEKCCIEQNIAKQMVVEASVALRSQPKTSFYIVPWLPFPILLRIIYYQIELLNYVFCIIAYRNVYLAKKRRKTIA